MSYILNLSKEAHQEETNAYNYYEGIEPGLGDRFLVELKKGYLKIADNPAHYSYLQTSKVIRSFKIERFPYIIIYLFSGDKVIVISVKNTYTRPFFK